MLAPKGSFIVSYAPKSARSARTVSTSSGLQKVELESVSTSSNKLPGITAACLMGIASGKFSTSDDQ